ncbi:AMP-dependent synthetase and ligase [Sulfobacillus acidophilus TPY]|uniref:O-succinylbenzoate--CoA ligase n=1 Tax=Sulfobacillus acidophilus (strain ATCC 700253 / DSM 10332 / NAL) TaxID=679936 RepID=G8TVM5_SULAD|nr:AMP-dependent synthetase and ligase [Sulfobacillus acidophilus TPY]AEW03664.1 o-succinylbenzoate--CoA ligase [Sulfobacillus acidophilus DSM 10332]
MIVPVTPLDFGRRAFKLYPDRLAVVDGPLRLTYRDLAERTYRLAHGLKAAGLRPGDRVAVLAPNTHTMLETFYGVPWAGLVLVPLNTRLTPEEYRYILTHSGSRALIADGRLWPLIAPVAEGLPLILVDGDAPPGTLAYEDWLSRQSADPIPLDVPDENGLITLNYTSGTTSRPKGVMLTHRNTFMNAVNFLLHHRMAITDRYLHTLPLFHVNGWGDAWAVTAVGAVHVMMSKVEGQAMWDLIHQEGVTALCGAPAVLNMLATTPHAPLDHPVRIATAGAPPPAALLQTLAQEGIEILHVYGLTEVSPWITVSEIRPEDHTLSPEALAAKMSCQGVEQILAGEVKVVHEDGTEVAHDGQDLGEIVNRSNVVMAGYYQDPEKTAEVIRDGWFHTGDLAVVHSDGSIQIRDRAKDIIISGGENISSVEVEDVLYRHPGVYEAAVVAVPDDKWGETPKAFIVPKPGMTVTAEELRQFCRDRLAHYKVPTSFEFVEALPRTASGKVQKYVLRKPYWEGRQSHVN